MNFMEAFNRLTESYDDAIEPGSGFLFFLDNTNSKTILNLLSTPPVSNLALESHLFITPDGAIINIDDYSDLMFNYFSDFATESGYSHNMHSDFIKLLWCLYLDKENKTLDEITEAIEDEDLADILDTAFIILVAKHGWVRYTYDPEYRGYPFIQCSDFKKPTVAQYEALEQLLVKAEEIKLPFYVEFLNDSGQPVAKNTYRLGDKDYPLFAEDVLKRITRFYTTGRLNEKKIINEFSETYSELDSLHEWKLMTPPTQSNSTSAAQSNTKAGPKKYQVTYYDDNGVQQSFIVTANSKSEAEDLAWYKVDVDSVYVSELDEELELGTAKE